MIFDESKCHVRGFFLFKVKIGENNFIRQNFNWSIFGAQLSTLVKRKNRVSFPVSGFCRVTREFCFEAWSFILFIRIIFVLSWRECKLKFLYAQDNGRSSSSSCATPKNVAVMLSIVFNPILVYIHTFLLRKIPCSANDYVYEDGEITMATGVTRFLIGQILIVTWNRRVPQCWWWFPIE